MKSHSREFRGLSNEKHQSTQQGYGFTSQPSAVIKIFRKLTQEASNSIPFPVKTQESHSPELFVKDSRASGSNKTLLPKIQGALLRRGSDSYQNILNMKRSASIDPSQNRTQNQSMIERKLNEKISFQNFYLLPGDIRFESLLGAYVRMIISDTDLDYLKTNFPGLIQHQSPILIPSPLVNMDKLGRPDQQFPRRMLELSPNRRSKSKFLLRMVSQGGEDKSFENVVRKQKSENNFADFSLTKPIGATSVTTQHLLNILEEEPAQRVLNKQTINSPSCLIRIFITVNQTQLEAGLAKLTVSGERIKCVDVSMFYIQKSYRKSQSTWEKILREFIVYLQEEYQAARIFLRTKDSLDFYIKLLQSIGFKLEKSLNGELSNHKVFSIRPLEMLKAKLE